MSFINQVMAEAGCRHELATLDREKDQGQFFHGPNLSDLEDGPDYKEVQSRNTRVFLIALLLILIGFQLVDRLPVQARSQLDFSHVAPIEQAYATSMHNPTMPVESFVADANKPEIKASATSVDKTSFRRLVVTPGSQGTAGGLKLVEVPTDQGQHLIKKTAVEVLHDDLLKQAQLASESSPPITTSKKPTAKFEIKPSAQNRKQRVTAQDMTLAKEALHAGELNDAIVRLTEFVTQSPQHSEARLLLSRAWIKAGDAQKAAQVLKDGLGRVKEPAQLAQPLARLYVENGQIDTALALLEKAAPVVAVDPEYHSFIAALQQQQGLHKAAIARYQAVLKHDPYAGKWWLGLGISLLAELHLPEARHAFEQVMRDQRVPTTLKQFAQQRLNALDKLETDRTG